MRRLLLLALLLGVAACASRQALVVVLPKDNGEIGGVTVDDGKNHILLDQPYAASEVRRGSAALVKVDAPEVQQIFGQAIAARPILPTHFSLYFVSDSNQLTPESQRLYRAVFDDIHRRPVYQVEVIGHTDTVGNQAYNQRLSLQRAITIRAALARDGLAMTAISVAGRGELDPAVPTAAQVSEPRNRRVEITVR